MWNEQQFESLASAIDGVTSDSRIVVVDNAGNGDVCEWLCEQFPIIGTLYSNQEIEQQDSEDTEDAEENEGFRTPRDAGYEHRAKRLSKQKCQVTSMTSDNLLARLGGRRFDVVVSGQQFRTDEKAAAWAKRWLPVTTGKVIAIVDGNVLAMDGECEIPERTPPVRNEAVVDRNPVNDINSLPTYKRR